MKPVFTQELVPDTRSLQNGFVPEQSVPGTIDTGRRVRASFTVLGLALSLGTSGTVLSHAEAADSRQFAFSPAAAGSVSGPLPSYGSDRPQGAAATYHTVVKGETLWDIAKRHGVALETIEAANGITEDQVIQVGQVLKVPAPSQDELLTRSVFEDPTGAEPRGVSPDVQPDLQVAAAPLSLDTAVTSLREQAPTSASTHTPANLSAFLAEGQADSQLSTTRSLPGLETPAAAAVSEAASLEAESPRSELDAAERSPVAKPQGTPPMTAPTLAWEPRSAAEQSSQASSLSTDAMIHRVGKGETVWSIARTYGLDLDDLRQVNELANPDLILPGDRLVIPQGDQSKTDELTTASPEEVRPTPEGDADGIRAWSPATVAGMQQPIPPTTAPSGVGPVSRQAADPHVARLLSQVAAATEARLAKSDDDVSPNQAAATHTTEANPTTDSLAFSDSPLDVEAVNPEFVAPGETAPTQVPTSELSSEELLAAAPLGSEVYAPVMERPEGRVVSPDMPVLPGQEEYLPEAPNRFDGYIWPAQGVLTSGYGWRWGRMHQGIDIAGPVGTPIFAAAPGVVVRSGWNSGGYGNMVDIRHPDGSLTRYAHNSRLLVREGQQVRQGQQIAEMGSTGYSTGPHLHFEVHLPDQGTVNPTAYLPSR